MMRGSKYEGEQHLHYRHLLILKKDALCSSQMKAALLFQSGLNNEMTEKPQARLHWAQHPVSVNQILRNLFLAIYVCATYKYKNFKWKKDSKII